MSVQLPEKTGQEQDAGTPRMVHLSFSVEAPFVALCGAVLRGDDAEHRELDCIVCAEMGREFE